MILKVSCISVAYNAAFMRVNSPITLSTSLADPDPEIIWGTGGGEACTKISALRASA